jgi:pSer/pThr/pTyr-binding forkhead associated (FHA) protein
MKARLFDARHGNREIPLEKLPVLLGRGADAGIQVLDGFASRRHCVISERDGALFVRDLGSKNGSFVNGHHASESSLRPGDKLAVGATTFVVSYETSQECQIPEGAADAAVVGTSITGDPQDVAPVKVPANKGE